MGILDPKNVTVEVYEHSNFGGSSRVFAGEVKNIGPAMNDKMSCFRIKIDEAAERKLKLQQAIDKARQDAELKRYEDERLFAIPRRSRAQAPVRWNRVS